MFPPTALRHLLTAAGLFLASPLELAAQGMIPAGRRQLVGVVRNPAGAALEGVAVSVPGTTIRTDVRGAFQLLTIDVDTVTISLRMLGFEPIDALLTARNKLWDTVLVQMEPTSQKLSNVKVTGDVTRSALALRDFEERRARGLGIFIGREEIVERGSSRLSDMLRTKRGVNVVPVGKVRFAAYTGGRSTMCQPYVFLDGVLSRGTEVDDILPGTVEAMELYPYMSTVPIEFQTIGSRTYPCGTIVIWTRIPGGRAP